MEGIGETKVSIESNIPELSEKVKRLQQILDEAEILIREIREYELRVNVKISDS